MALAVLVAAVMEATEELAVLAPLVMAEMAETAVRPTAVLAVTADSAALHLVQAVRAVLAETQGLQTAA